MVETEVGLRRRVRPNRCERVVFTRVLTVWAIGIGYANLVGALFGQVDQAVLNPDRRTAC